MTVDYSDFEIRKPINTAVKAEADLEKNKSEKETAKDETKEKTKESSSTNNEAIFFKPDAADGRDATKLIENVFGSGSAKYSRQNSNILHITEVKDNETGRAFKFTALQNF